MRFHWVDTAKTLLIFLVVLGHLHYIYAPVPGKNLIYAFHVPAFLFITGFLAPIDFGQFGISQVISKWIATYLRAYAFFSVIAIFLWWAMMFVRSGEISSPLPALTGTIYGIAGSDNGLVHENQPLWYFPFLMTSVLGGWVCARLGNLGWILAIAYALFSLLYQGDRLPWALDISGIGTLVFYSGHTLRQKYSHVQLALARPETAVVLSVTMGAALFLFSSLNGSTNLNGSEFGRSGLLYILATYSGIFMIVALSAAAPQTRLAQLVSADTLVIFALHIYFLRILSKFAPTSPESTGERLTVMIFISFLAVFGCMVIARLIQPTLDRIVTRPVRGGSGDLNVNRH